MEENTMGRNGRQKEKAPRIYLILSHPPSAKFRMQLHVDSSGAPRIYGSELKAHDRLGRRGCDCCFSRSQTTIQSLSATASARRVMEMGITPMVNPGYRGAERILSSGLRCIQPWTPQSNIPVLHNSLTYGSDIMRKGCVE